MGTRRIVITGAAGFIGLHLTRRLIKSGHEILGLDHLGDPHRELKEARLAQLEGQPGFRFKRLDLCDPKLASVLKEFDPSVVIHLAARSGTRESVKNPMAYVHSNLEGFVNLGEAARDLKLDHFIYASSSSVYGANKKTPFSTGDRADHPVSIYAATKRSNELMAHTYSHLYGIPMTGLRFFTVYGSWGRPDMAYYSFSQKLLRGETIELFDGGELERDFTHVSDICESIYRLIDLPPPPDSESGARHRLFNIGASSPVKVKELVTTLAELLDKKPEIRRTAMQPGDVQTTHADIADLERTTGYAPRVGLREGLREFVDWFKSV